MSGGNTCTSEPNLEVLPLKDYVCFFLLKALNDGVRSDVTINLIVLLSDKSK